MLERAQATGVARNIDWRQADATNLQFDANSFDLVVCQFGAMFFPDRQRCYAEVRRVLREDGTFLFSVWDDLASNEIAFEVTQVLSTMFPKDQPKFMERTPHGYHSQDEIRNDLAKAGFTRMPSIDVVTKTSVAADARVAAVAYCQGTPLRSEIERVDAHALDHATDVITEALRQRFGSGQFPSQIRALIVSVAK
jgi:SAM-dependent methyltransferase